MKVIYASHSGLPFDAESYRQVLVASAPPGFTVDFLAPDATETELAAAVADADFLLGFPRATATVLEHGKRLKLVQVMGAGYDYLDAKAAARLGIKVANSTGANAGTVAEHAIMLMLAIFHNLEALIVKTRSGRWRDGIGDDDLHELAGRTVGILGFGNIGRGVARRLQGWELTLQYYDQQRQPEHEHLATYRPLEELLASSDVITIHTPLSGSSRHLINRETLALMKPTTVLVNTSRGPVVDEAALYEALTTGRLLAAGLDVWEQEPPDPSNPLLKLPNVVPTPHAAGLAFETWTRRCAGSFENFRRVVAGEEPLRRVV